MNLNPRNIQGLYESYTTDVQQAFIRAIYNACMNTGRISTVSLRRTGQRLRPLDEKPSEYNPLHMPQFLCVIGDYRRDSKMSIQDLENRLFSIFGYHCHHYQRVEPESMTDRLISQGNKEYGNEIEIASLGSPTGVGMTQKELDRWEKLDRSRIPEGAIVKISDKCLGFYRTEGGSVSFGEKHTEPDKQFVIITDPYTYMPEVNQVRLDMFGLQHHFILTEHGVANLLESLDQKTFDMIKENGLAKRFSSHDIQLGDQEFVLQLSKQCVDRGGEGITNYEDDEYTGTLSYSTGYLHELPLVEIDKDSLLPYYQVAALVQDYERISFHSRMGPLFALPVFRTEDEALEKTAKIVERVMEVSRFLRENVFKQTEFSAVANENWGEYVVLGNDPMLIRPVKIWTDNPKKKHNNSGPGSCPLRS